MTDFDDALERALERNAEVAENRARAEQEMARVESERRAAAERRAEEEAAARDRRHAELVARLDELLGRLASAAPDRVDARAGWSPSGVEYLATVSTVGLSPRRTLSLELDRDDDEVLARWRSDVGDSIEMWRLHEFSTDMLAAIVLQVVDEDQWATRTGPPAFPRT